MMVGEGVEAGASNVEVPILAWVACEASHEGACQEGGILAEASFQVGAYLR